MTTTDLSVDELDMPYDGLPPTATAEWAWPFTIHPSR